MFDTRALPKVKSREVYRRGRKASSKSGSSLMEKRTPRRHTGQSADRSAAGGGNAPVAGRFRRARFVKAITFWWPRSNLLRVCSRAVGALSSVSARCPFLHERREQPPIAVT